MLMVRFRAEGFTVDHVNKFFEDPDGNTAKMMGFPPGKEMAKIQQLDPEEGADIKWVRLKLPVPGVSPRSQVRDLYRSDWYSHVRSVRKLRRLADRSGIAGRR